MSEFNNSENGAGSSPHPYRRPYSGAPLTAETLEDIFGDCGDLESRPIYVGLEKLEGVTALWIDGVVDGDGVSEMILRPLTASRRMAWADTSRERVDYILHGAVYSNTVKERDTAFDVADDLAHGYCAIVFDDIEIAVTFEVRTGNVRSIGEPTIEKSVKGAKDAFVETLRINTSLVRRRICSPKLKLRHTVIGRKSMTRCAVMFVEGVADPAVIDELINRLDKIDIDGLLASGYIEDYIVDRPLSPLPQVIHTERPDRFSSLLLNGRVGLIVDGLPLGFVVPVSLPALMRVPQDATNNYAIATALSLLRWTALFLSLALPGIFVAVMMFHQEMVPTQLLLSIIAAKQDVPFSLLAEVLAMLLAFGLLQEAGLRLPNPVGDTVSIIGALIVGQSAVDARVVSPIAVIVVALAGICGYTAPSQDLSGALRLFRLILVLLGSALGLFGVAAGLCLMLWYLCSVESYGVNYMSPMSSGRPEGFLRAVLRVPKFMNKNRDPDLHTPDRRRQR